MDRTIIVKKILIRVSLSEAHTKCFAMQDLVQFCEHAKFKVAHIRSIIQL